MLDQNYELTPTLSCLRSALYEMNSHKVYFLDRTTTMIASYDCKDDLIESICVSYVAPVYLRLSKSYSGGYLAISVKMTTGEYMDDYACIDEEDYDLLQDALTIFGNFINDED